MASTNHRIYSLSIAELHRLYVAKAERKGRDGTDVDVILRWLTGYDQAGLDAQLARGCDLATFFGEAPEPNPDRHRITGVVCGVRVEDIDEPLMQEIRYADKLVDELARGKKMSSILRG